jgi:hypothetical protein
MAKSKFPFTRNDTPPKAPVKIYASLVITLDPDTGDVSCAGNILRDTKTCVLMLIEAAHKLINTPIEERKEAGDQAGLRLATMPAQKV